MIIVIRHFRRFGRARLSASLFMPLLLAGCASFTGHPNAVITTTAALSVIESYKIPGVFQSYAAAADKEAYRNEDIAAYLQAIDARYYEFRSDLSSQRKGSDLAFDALLLGLSGGASLAKRAADEAEHPQRGDHDG